MVSFIGQGSYFGVTAVGLAVLVASSAIPADASRDHDELPRVTACQERLADAAEQFREIMRGYDLAFDIRAAERPLTAKGQPPVTCAIRQADNVPALNLNGNKN